MIVCDQWTDAPPAAPSPTVEALMRAEAALSEAQQALAEAQTIPATEFLMAKQAHRAVVHHANALGERLAWLYNAGRAT